MNRRGLIDTWTVSGLFAAIATLWLVFGAIVAVREAVTPSCMEQWMVAFYVYSVKGGSLGELSGNLIKGLIFQPPSVESVEAAPKPLPIAKKAQPEIDPGPADDEEKYRPKTQLVWMVKKANDSPDPPQSEQNKVRP